MTLANQITLGRIFLIPVFVGLAVSYAETVRAGRPDDALRWWALGVFVVASASDALDGFIARRFNQRSRLGRLLDPLADKGLLLAAILTLSFTPWPWHFPLWFPLLVVTRDLLLIGGALLIHHLVGAVEVQPHWTGKCATFFQMLAVGWVMMEWMVPDPIWPTALAGLFTAASSVVYLRHAVAQLRMAGHHGADLG